MTTAVDSEIEAYVADVGAALADVPDEARVELLDDLAGHLAEVRSESDGATLRERLGDPAEYAAELRAAAGYPPIPDAPAPQPSVAAALAQFRRRLDQADRAVGALLGYGRVLDAARTLRPGWWVLRGWIVAQIVAGAFRHAHWTGFVPRIGGSGGAYGWLVLGACVPASLWVGHRTARGTAQTRLLAVLVSIAVAVFGVFIARNVVGADYMTYRVVPGGSSVIAPAPSASPSP